MRGSRPVAVEMDETRETGQSGATRRTVLQLLGVTAGLATIGTGDALENKPKQADESDSYTLPPLGYDYDALEPAIDEQIMRLHHDEHHQGYVDGANNALDELTKMREKNQFDNIKSVKRNLSFNLSGHILHSVFWRSMSPAGGGKPSGELADALVRDFGSVDAAIDEFSAGAERVEGSGWGLLVYDHLADRLLVTQAEVHNDLAIQGATPLLVLDMWEHAYYLQYTNNREKYVNAFFEVVDWIAIEWRYEKVRLASIFG